ncbi:MAG TPA: cupin domain-containing protein [Bryobacteraceae bacterium]|nr:cupin domain-containing protein [Bryobacteraceae bacterium]
MIATPIRLEPAEAVQRPGAEPPLHVHEREDETIYVLEGRIDVFLEGIWHDLVPGESIFMPRGVPHTFRIRSSEARAVTVITPGGFESCFRALGKRADIFGISR